jgi:hypothetical protein
MQKWVWVLGVILSVSVGAAPEKVCVRNYITKEGAVPCERFPLFYTFVIPAEKLTEKVCTRIYSNFYCKTAKEYVTVASLEGKGICVLNNDQEPVVNFCKSLPQFYAYIKRFKTDQDF